MEYRAQNGSIYIYIYIYITIYTKHLEWSQQHGNQIYT